MTSLQQHLIPDLLKSLNEYKFLAIKSQIRFLKVFLRLVDTGYVLLSQKSGQMGEILCS